MVAHDVGAVADVRWFPILETEPSTYNRLRSEQVAGRYITKYALEDQEGATIDRAVNVVRALLLANPNLCPVFPLDPLENLRVRIARNPYLTVNGEAVCLSEERSTIQAIYKDRFFSEGSLVHPVRCPRGHVLELESARIWADHKGGMCPVLPQHLIGDFVEDQELAHDAAEFRAAERERREQSDRLVQQQQTQALQIQIHHNQIAVRRELSTGEVCFFGGDGAKIVLKIGVKKLCTTLAKQTTEQVAEQVAKTGVQKFASGAAKKIPFVSLGLGVSLGVYRATQGQGWRAVGEVVSGFASCFPGIGTAASVVLDVVIAGDDVYEVVHRGDGAPVLEVTLTGAYHMLGIEPIEPPPTKAVVDRAYRAQLPLIHPDALHQLGEAYVAQAQEMSEAVNAARDFIYVQRNWR
jgi:hypothetical protein